MGTALGGWGVVTLLQRKVTALLVEIQILQEDKNTLENTTARLQERTWGLKLIENQDGRFIILPSKTSPKLGWTVGKQQAVKLE